MKTSRRKFITAGMGLAAGMSLPRTSLAQQVYRREGEERPRATMELADFQPRSMLKVPVNLVTRSKYTAIDCHTHMGDVYGRRRGTQPATPLPGADEYIAQAVRTMDELNLKMLVHLTGGHSDELELKISRLDRRYPGRFLTMAEPNYLKLADSGYDRWQAEDLERSREMGAIGLKILKGHGLSWRENVTEGPLLAIDDPRFDPMWDMAGRLGMSVFIHTADPDAFFVPIDRFNERWEELGNHPNWSFYGDEYPSKPELLAARNRVIERHPGTTFVGLHIANHPEDLDNVSGWLDQYPNLHVETAARLGELGRQPRRAREFFLKYQDRIMFGTDATPTEGTPQQDFKPEMYHNYFRFAETYDEYFDYAPSPTPPQGRWMIYGIELPDEVLKKFYHNNFANLMGLELI